MVLVLVLVLVRARARVLGMGYVENAIYGYLVEDLSALVLQNDCLNVECVLGLDLGSNFASLLTVWNMAKASIESAPRVSSLEFHYVVDMGTDITMRLLWGYIQVPRSNGSYLNRSWNSIACVPSPHMLPVRFLFDTTISGFFWHLLISSIYGS